MFYYISGKLVTTEANAAIVDNHGIAYRMTVSGTTQAKLTSKVGEEVRLYTYLNIYQDGMDLFGFHSKEEHGAFCMLISVSGVGPKAAMSVLSVMSPEKLALAIGSEDTKTISKAPGVGAKTAARIVLELKDKIAKQMSAEGGDRYVGGADVESNPKGAVSEAVNALLVLGYSRAEAMSALSGIDLSLSVEDMLKNALKKLVK